MTYATATHKASRDYRELIILDLVQTADGRWKVGYKIPELFVKGRAPPSVYTTVENGHQIIHVPVTPFMKRAAHDLAEKIHENRRQQGSVERFPTIKFKRNPIDTETAGFLGHFAVAEYLRGDWRSAADGFRIEPGLSDVDLEFWGYKFEVKTRSRRAYDFLLVPEKDLQKGSDFFIGCQLIRDRPEWEVLVHGYATPDDLKAAPLRDFGYGPSHAISLTSLHPLEDLLRLKPPDEPDGRKVDGDLSEEGIRE